MTAIFKSSLQNLSPLPTRFKVKSTQKFHGLSCFVKSAKSKTTDFTILFTKFKTKVLNLSLNLGSSPLVKLAPEVCNVI